jgi:hypothetical protein
MLIDKNILFKNYFSDFKDYDDSFQWNIGGDGDNGETLSYQLDAFFEYMDQGDST